MTGIRLKLETWGAFITRPRLAAIWVFIAPMISIVSPRVFILYLALHAAALSIPLWLAIYEPESRFSAKFLPDRRQLAFWAKWVAAFVGLFILANINSGNHSDSLQSTLHVFTALYAIAIYTCGIRVVGFSKIQLSLQSLLWGVIATGAIFFLMWLTYFFRYEFPEGVRENLIPLSSDFNRALVVFVLLGGLAVWHAVITGQNGKAWIAGGLMIVAATLSRSESAMLAAFVLLAVTVLVRVWSEFTIRALGGLALVWIWVMPWLWNSILDFVAASTWINTTGKNIQAIYTSLARLEIWSAASDRIAERPILGWGHDGVQHFGLPTIRGIFFPIKTPLHPHNGALQAWIDLGIFGPIAMSVAVILMCRYLLRATGWTQPFLTALAFAAISVIFVSHGLWQTWWIGLLGYLFGTGLVLVEFDKHLRT